MSERSRLSILSVCRSLPTPDDPSSGVFVMNRLAGLAQVANVRVVQPRPWFPVAAPLPAWARTPSRTNSGLRIEHAPMFYIPAAFKSLDAFWLRRAVQGRLNGEARDLDLIDAHFGYPEGVGCIELGQRLGVPVFITIRGFETEYLQKPVIGPLLEKALRAATGIVSVSHSLRDLAIRHGAAPAKVRVIHNAIDRDIFHPGDQAAARAKVGVEPGARLIVSVGHLVSRKRHHVLIEAFGKLFAQDRNAKLVIIGAKSFEPDYPQRLLQLARTVNAGEGVVFAGNVRPDLVGDWLRAADVFALGTAREGCCNAVLEALGAGAPVVTTPVGDNAHFVTDGQNGHLVPVDDAAAMHRALADALARKNWDRERISATLAVGDWAQIGASVEEFFRERLGQLSAARDYG